MPNERGRQLTRCIRLLSMLKAGRQPLEQLALDLNVSTRTIRRDLIALHEAGVPVRTFGTDIGQVWTAQ